MIGPAYLAWLSCLLCGPLLALCFLLDGLLKKRASPLRRQVWIVGFLGCLLLSALPLGWMFQTLDPTAYWGTARPPGSDVLDGAIAETGRVLRAVMPAVSLPETAGHDSTRGIQLDIIYVLGLIGILLRLAIAQSTVRRYVRRTAAVQDGRLLQRCRVLADRMGTHQAVRLRWHPDAACGCSPPAAAGLWRASILLPRSAAGWTPHQQDCVLLHELAHVRHRDNAWRALATVLCALQWFNPLAWLALRRMRDVSEMAADDVAARGVGRTDAYAATLVTLARNLRLPSLPLASMADHALTRRVKHLLNVKPPLRRSTGAAILGLILLTVTATGAVGIVASVAGSSLVGWEPQQYRWESADAASGLFVHGEIDLAPGHLDIGGEGLLLLVHENPSGLATCVAWRDPALRVRFECDADRQPQHWLDQRLAEAAGQWPFDPDSPLAAYWHGRDEDRFAGSRITGIPGSSRNPVRNIVQAGWIDDDGSRVGVMLRDASFRVAFRYLPRTRELLLLREVAGSGVERWSNSGWGPAPERDQRWFSSVMDEL